MDSPDLLTITTVLYGGASTLERTLPSWVHAASALPVRFLFIDNSEDGAARAVVERQSWRSGAIVYLHSGANVGFAAAVNHAMREATTDAVFLLNPDVTLVPGQLERLLELPPVVNPRAVSLVTGGRVTAGISLNKVGWFSDRPLSSTVPCLGPSGGAAVFSRSQFIALGGLTDELFAWGEDAALALRLWSAGIETEVVDLRLDHSGGHSVASLQGLRRKAFWLARNRIWILRAQYSRSYQMSVGVLLLVMLLVNGARKIPARTGRAYFRGVAAGLLVRPPWHVDEVMTVRMHRAYRAAKSAPLPAAETAQASTERTT